MNQPGIKIVGNIFIMNRIGNGTQGSVFLCKKKEDYDVPEKINDTPFILCTKMINKNQEKDKFSERETNLLIEMEHINIIKSILAAQTLNNFYLVMDYFPGDNLESLLARNKEYMTSTITRNYIAQIINAFRYLHKARVIHRDVKPSNILLAEKNEVIKICDFGFARKVLTDDLLLTRVGTPLYSSPQLLSNETFTNKCDVWSCGLIFYQLINKKLPFSVTRENVLKLGQFLMTFEFEFPENNLPEFYNTLIKGMLGKKEEDRLSWPDVINFLEENDVEELQDGYALTKFTISKGQKFTHRISKKNRQRILSLEVQLPTLTSFNTAKEKLTAVASNIKHQSLMSIHKISYEKDKIFVHYSEYLEDNLSNVTNKLRFCPTEDVLDRRLCIVRQLINLFSFLRARDVVHGYIRANEIYINEYIIKVPNLGLIEVLEDNVVDMLDYVHPNFDFINGKWSSIEEMWSLWLLLHKTMTGLNPFNKNRYSLNKTTINHLINSWKSNSHLIVEKDEEWGFLWSPLLNYNTFSDSQIKEIEEELRSKEEIFYKSYLEFSNEKVKLLLTFNQTLYFLDENSKALQESLGDSDFQAVFLLTITLFKMNMEEALEELTAHGFIPCISEHRDYKRHLDDMTTKLNEIGLLLTQQLEQARVNHPTKKIIENIRIWAADLKLYSFNITKEYSNFIQKLEPFFQENFLEEKVIVLGVFMKLLKEFENSFKIAMIYHPKKKPEMLNQVFLKAKGKLFLPGNTL